MPLNPAFPAVSGAANFDHIRRDLSGLVVSDAAGVPRAGVFSRNNGALLSARADRAVNVGPFEAALYRAGVLFTSHDGTSTVPIDAAPAANARKDVIYVKQFETRAPLSDPRDGPEFGVLKGTPAPDPQKPTNLPEGALELGVVHIPAGATTTQSAGVVVSTTCRYTATEGGVVMVRDDADLQAWTPHDMSLATRLDNGREYRRLGGAWVDRRFRERKDAFSGGTIARGGVSYDVGSWTRTFAVPTDITVEVGAYFYWPANAAGHFVINIDGARVDARRYHTHDKSGFDTPSHTLFATVPAGTHTIAGAITVDSSSVSAEMWDGSAVLTIFS